MSGMNKEILNIGLTTALLIAIPACARHQAFTSFQRTLDAGWI